ncbi:MULTISPECIES: hypothetical protein [unclassified Streptomyces]|uniref:hypothetical protein n=1 Tax=unclassified Streptomyces TaxID=2593676 RepID=UPI0033A725C5
MSLAVGLLTTGTTFLAVGGTVACNVRGSAKALARRAAAQAELARYSRGDLGAPQRIMSTTVYRYMGSVVALGGLVLILGGLLELAF